MLWQISVLRGYYLPHHQLFIFFLLIQYFVLFFLFFFFFPLKLTFSSVRHVLDWGTPVEWSPAWKSVYIRECLRRKKIYFLIIFSSSSLCSKNQLLIREVCRCKSRDNYFQYNAKKVTFGEVHKLYKQIASLQVTLMRLQCHDTQQG